MTYTSYIDLYKISEISFIAGSTIFLDFEVLSSNGSPFNILDSTFTWKLSPYGNKDYVVLTKTTPTIINTNTVRVTLTSTDTDGLFGKYVQELTSVGSELTYGEFTALLLDFPLIVGTAQPDEVPTTDVSLPSILYVQGNLSSVTGNVVIDGLDEEGAVASETIALNGTNKVTSSTIFSTVYYIDFPAGVSSGETVTVGAEAQLLQDVSEVQQGVVIISKKLG